MHDVELQVMAHDQEILISTAGGLNIVLDRGAARSFAKILVHALAAAEADQSGVFGEVEAQVSILAAEPRTYLAA